MYFSLDSASEQPIYQQITEAVQKQIGQGQLKNGDQLPTVRELAKELGLACGTVTRAYDELEKKGVIQRTRGRGTFINTQIPNADSRKEQAMAAIDKLLDQLEKLNFSPKEMEIYLELKLRERAERGYDVQIALVDCNPETLAMMAEQIYGIAGVDLYRLLLADVSSSPYKVAEGMDLVITTATHYRELQRLLPGMRNMQRIALNTAPATVVELAKLHAGCRVGVVTKSTNFAHVVYRGCASFAPQAVIEGSYELGGEEDLAAFLQNKDAVVLPQGWENLCSRLEQATIEKWQGMLIPYGYFIDDGSLMYLEERLLSLQRKKRGK